MIVLDASAVLAVLFGEAGGDRVADHFGEAVLCSANLAEVISKLDDRGANAEQIKAVADQFGPMTRPLTTEVAIAAGLMRRDTRDAGLSLGDRCCLAFARDLGAAAMTADRAWTEIRVGPRIVVIR